jgi:hypothetical protein
MEERELNEAAAPEGSQPVKRGWWKRRSKKAKFFLVVLTLIVLLVGISAAAGGGGDGTASTSNPSTEPQSTDATPDAVAAPIVHGTWKPECNQYSAGDLDACRAVKASKVSCQWQGDNVHMSVTFRNTFSAHVTVHMDPIYKLQNAGLHGNGLTSTKDVGLDPGELRTVTVDENPAGVDAQPAITMCGPKVDVLSGVELG